MRFAVFVCFALLAGIRDMRAGYDPLDVPQGEIKALAFTVKDAARQRDVPLRIYLPPDSRPDAAPVVLFSHGLGGSREGGVNLGKHWAGRGYMAVFLQHPGSDEAVWKSAPLPQRRAKLVQAASAANHLARVRDVPAVLDALAEWEKKEDHPLHGRLDLEHVGMAGHSFGARTTQMIAGQKAGPRMSFREPRIDAAAMLSPSPPTAGDPARAFAAVDIPCLLVTGTRDDSPIGGTAPADRLKVFPFLKTAPAWQLVLDGATHSDVGGRPSGGDAARYETAILAITTAFWDACLKSDPAARSWLAGKGIGELLQDADRWSRSGTP